MRVINLAAGPGAGKSTTAAGLFNIMKLKGLKVELNMPRT
jgi:dephospho-CoA kinase